MAKGKKKNTKNTSKAEGGGDASQKRTYLKIEATFKCSNSGCGKAWRSVHAWEREEEIWCDLCDGKVNVVNVLDEQCELDNFDCLCGSHWQSIHGDGTEEECYDCSRMVSSNGTQIRFGRHFWFACTKCAVQFEDFSTSTQRTQRCSNCKSRGDIIGTKKVKPMPFWRFKLKSKERDEAGGDCGGGGGSISHNWEYCDMCQDLKGQGKAKSCLNFQKVFCELKKLDDGITGEKIVGVSSAVE